MNDRFDQLFNEMWAQKVPFFLVFFLVTVITYGVLVFIDFIPEPIAEDTAATATSTEIVVADEPAEPAAVTEPTEPEVLIDPLPVRVAIEETGTDVEIFNPDTLDIAELDAILLDGVVRHPQSADFGDPGNMLIFGHSSYLPNVLNPNFQAFNGVQDLEWGDQIYLESSDTEYVYRVDKVYLAKASETVIDNSRGAATLTIVTCNSFATTDDRFIVEATLVETNLL